MKRMAAVAVALGLASGVQAQVYKCPDASGKVTYQAEPCDGGKTLQAEPKKPAPTSARDRLFGDSGIMASAKCVELSGSLFSVGNRTGTANRTREDLHRIEEFRRDCQPLGFQYPDTRASHQHNQTVHAQRVEELAREWERATQRPQPRSATKR